jgi:hypothetical protein
MFSELYKAIVEQGGWYGIVSVVFIIVLTSVINKIQTSKLDKDQSYKFWLNILKTVRLFFICSFVFQLLVFFDNSNILKSLTNPSSTQNFAPSQANQNIYSRIADSLRNIQNEENLKRKEQEQRELQEELSRQKSLIEEERLRSEQEEAERRQQEREEQQEIFRQERLRAQNEREAQRRAAANAEAERKIQKDRSNLWGLITTDTEYQYNDILGGISNARLFVYNKSDYFVDKIIVKTEYVRQNGNIHKTHKFVINGMHPHSKETCILPSSEWGKKLNEFKTYVYCSALDIEIK